MSGLLLPDTATGHDDLRSGRSPWHAGTPRPGGGRLARDIRCEVLVVGSGITGALVAEHLSGLGREVVVIDRERPGFGSTLASTAMLQWEIDAPLRELAALYGFERAAGIYRRSLGAVAGLGALVRSLELACSFAERETIYLAAGDVGPRELLEEHALRRRAGLPGDLLDRGALATHCGLDREAAIVSPGSAEADPLCLTHALMRVAAGRGARWLRDEAVSFEGGVGSAFASLAGGATIEARHIVLATGYAMPDFVKSDLHSVASSWALATVPQQPARLWPERRLIWEASEDYIYARTTAEGRIVLGGGDEPIDDPEAREAATPAKRRELIDKLAGLWPLADLAIDNIWSGAFGQTSDGLPLIGRVPGHPRLLAAYGYGGNGITFSYMASRMIAALIHDAQEAWFDDFAIDRPNPL